MEEKYLTFLYNLYNFRNLIKPWKYLEILKLKKFNRNMCYVIKK
jgi:hypothetical protein